MKVLAHHRSPFSRCSSSSTARVVPYLLRHPCFVSIIAVVHFATAQAQVLFNGQVFTNGLAIVDAPAPNSKLHAGSNIDFAVDVSGNGKLPQIASSTGFDSLNVFLVSASTNLNLTVTDRPEFLFQEVGSTVKHLNWNVPSCVPSGSYNLTLYETSHLRGSSLFSITAIPLHVQNDRPNGACASQNAVDLNQQESTPLVRSPWLDTTVSAVSVSAIPPAASAPPAGFDSSLASESTASQADSPTATSLSAPPYEPSLLGSSVAIPDVITVTIGSQGVQWPLTVGPPTVPETVVIEQATSTISGMVTVVSVAPIPASANPGVAGSDGPVFGTLTVMVSPTAVATPVTVVFVSVETLTTTTTGPAGSSSIYTATSTSLSTTMGVMGPPSTGNSDYAGFLPINAVSFAIIHRVSLPIVLSSLCIIPVLYFL